MGLDHCQRKKGSRFPSGRLRCTPLLPCEVLDVGHVRTASKVPEVLYWQSFLCRSFATCTCDLVQYFLGEMFRLVLLRICLWTQLNLTLRSRTCMAERRTVYSQLWMMFRKWMTWFVGSPIQAGQTSRSPDESVQKASIDRTPKLLIISTYICSSFSYSSVYTSSSHPLRCITELFFINLQFSISRTQRQTQQR